MEITIGLLFFLFSVIILIKKIGIQVSIFGIRIFRYPQIRYPPEFLIAMKKAYGITENIKGMLLILEQEFKNEKIHVNILDSIRYLDESRYKDYETALKRYLSDDSWEFNEIYVWIMKKEMAKKYRIEKKMCRNSVQGKDE